MTCQKPLLLPGPHRLSNLGSYPVLEWPRSTETITVIKVPVCQCRAVSLGNKREQFLCTHQGTQLQRSARLCRIGEKSSQAPPGGLHPQLGGLLCEDEGRLRAALHRGRSARVTRHQGHGTPKGQSQKARKFPCALCAKVSRPPHGDGITHNLSRSSASMPQIPISIPPRQFHQVRVKIIFAPFILYCLWS